MRGTAVIFKTWGKFLGLIAVCLFIYWVDRVNRRGLITHPAPGRSGRCGKGSSLILLWFDILTRYLNVIPFLHTYFAYILKQVLQDQIHAGFYLY